MNNFIDNKIIEPMNKFAEKNPDLPLIISVIALVISSLCLITRLYEANLF